MLTETPTKAHILPTQMLKSKLKKQVVLSGLKLSSSHNSLYLVDGGK